MDIQLKRGLLDVCVLAAIKDEDSYGYKIIKDMKPYIELSESTLYTILKRLEAAQMLTVRTVVPATFWMVCCCHCSTLRFSISTWTTMPMSAMAEISSPGWG